MTATVNDQSITITDESLTVSESVGIYECDFTFDASWDTWNKTAVFEGAGATIEMIVVDNKAQIPWEVLKEAGWIKIGVYGTKGGEIKPTIWSDQIYVAAGTVPGSVEVTPTPSIYAQILDLANDAKDIAEDAEDTANDAKTTAEGVADDWAAVTAEASTLAAGSPASVSFANNKFTFGIPKGDTGATGAKGDKGDKGDTGATGAKGDKGDKGDTGATGAKGDKGDKGDTGATGAKGDKGDKGDNGDVANIADAYSTSATYAVGDYCIYSSQLYRCTTAIATAEAWTASHWTAVAMGDEVGDLRSALDSVEDTLGTKADTDGTYEDMAVGELISSNTNEDTEPYIFRKTGGSTKAGKREYLDKVVGVSLIENQLVNPSRIGATRTINGVTFTNNGDGSVSVSGTATADAMFPLYGERSWQAHKFLLNGCPSGGASTTYFLAMRGQGSDTYDYGSGTIWNATGNAYKEIVIYVKNGTTISSALKFVPQFIDLTAKYGLTIADYIYSLETAIAGAGVAWLKQYMDLDTYIPYAEPTLKHVEGLQSHDAVGFNQWDEVWEVGTINAQGQDALGNATIRSKNYIPILPNTAYYITNVMSGVFWYDADKNLISINYSGGTRMSPSNARYLRFYSSDEHGNTYKHDICINLSDPQKNGTYEPYVKHSYPLDSSVVLRGYPMLVDGKLKFDGDEYLPSGVIGRRYREVVFDGTENWGMESSSWNSHGLNAFYLMLGSNNQAYFTSYLDMPMLVCDKFVSASNSLLKTSDKTGLIGLAGGSGYANYIEILSDATDVTSFKTWLANNNTKIVYRLVTPTIETADPYQQVQICDPYGTEELVGAEIPVGTVTEYPEDLTAKIEGLPWDLSMIAPIEDGTTASQAYTAGQYFLHNNVFCKALTSIASGATFTLGTNYSETTIAAELYTALH